MPSADLIRDLDHLLILIMLQLIQHRSINQRMLFHSLKFFFRHHPGNGSARAHMASHPLLYNVLSLDKFCHLQSPAFLFLLSWSLHASLHSYHRVFPVFNNDSSSAPR